MKIVHRFPNTDPDDMLSRSKLDVENVIWLGALALALSLLLNAVLYVRVRDARAEAVRDCLSERP